MTVLLQNIKPLFNKVSSLFVTEDTDMYDLNISHLLTKMKSEQQVPDVLNQNSGKCILFNSVGGTQRLMLPHGF